MSAKAAVLARRPDAFAHSWADCWVIYAPHKVGRAILGNESMGAGKTAEQAWADAHLKLATTDQAAGGGP